MHICMVSRHGCIRVFKQSKALQLAGHSIEWIANEVPFGYNVFSTLTIYDDIVQLQNAVRNSNADIFHVHNEPDWIVWATKAVAGNRPVIYDVHDLESLRWNTEPDEDETKAFQAADGIIHTSKGCQKAAEKYHQSKPTRILYPYVNQEFIIPLERVGNVSWDTFVYQGGLDTRDEVKRSQDGATIYSMRDYRSIVDILCNKHNFNFVMYAAKNIRMPENDFTYEHLGANVFRELPYPFLLQAMRPFGFGLVGAQRSFPLMEQAMPNKLFEYMSQGVVPVVLNASYAAEFVTRENIGIAITEDQLLNQEDFKSWLYNTGFEMRHNIVDRRNQFAMENHIHIVEELYEELL